MNLTDSRCRQVRLLMPLGIGPAKCLTSLFDTEHPSNSGTGVIAPSLPRGDFSGKPVSVRYAPVETLACKYADLNLDHV